MSPEDAPTNSNTSRDGTVLFRAGLCFQREPQRVSEDGTAALPVQPYNPFVVAQTTSDIISNHTDIWNDSFEDWLFALISAVHVEDQRLRAINMR